MALRDELERVNKEVNNLPQFLSTVGQLTPAEDQGGGDCGDLVMEKFRKLMQVGFSMHDMGLCTASVNGQYHGVLGVVFEGDLLILDNLREEILPVQDVDYIWGYIPEYLARG